MAKGVVALAALAFIASVVWAFSSGQGFDLSAFYSDPWVAVGTADLFFGFTLMSVIIAWNERSPVRAAIWIVPLFFIGNLVSAAYLLVNANRIAGRLGAAEGKA